MNLQFATFNKNKTTSTFSFANDILTDANRVNTLLNQVNWTTTEFMVFGGDVLADLTSENSIFTAFVDPITTKFAKSKPIVYLRGNQEMNGSISPKIFSYVPTENSEFYYTFSHGPALFLVFDSRQDSADANPRYGGLMRSEPYLQKELAWFQDYIQKNAALIAAAPFKIALAHQPNLGIHQSGSLGQHGELGRGEAFDSRTCADLLTYSTGNREEFSYSNSRAGSGVQR